MVEITDKQLKDARFYHEVFMLLTAFATGKKLPLQDFDTYSINKSFKILRGILSMKK